MKFKKDMIYLAIALLALFCVLKVVFYKESIVAVGRTTLSFFWLFILPGYFIMYHWREKINVFERILIGSGISIAIMGIGLYYIGMTGANVIFYGLILPLIIIVINVLLFFGRRYFKRGKLNG